MSALKRLPTLEQRLLRALRGLRRAEDALNRAEPTAAGAAFEALARAQATADAAIAQAEHHARALAGTRHVRQGRRS